MQIVKLAGENELEAIHFNKEGDYSDSKVADTEYVMATDLVICENGIDRPKFDLTPYVGAQDEGSERRIATGGETRIPHTNTRFSLVHNDIHSPIFAVGAAAEFPSFVQKQRMRCDDSAYNVEAAFYAAMNMMDKRVEFRYIPHTFLSINDKPVHFVGERSQRFSEVVVDGEMSSGRFIVWYIWGEEIVGFCTVGYSNLHLYLWEAMKLLIMPPATQLRNGQINHKAIVAKVLSCRPEIKAKRSEITKLPSIIRAEFTRERETLDDFKGALKQNIADENLKAKKRFKMLKEKYDKDGIEFVEDEREIGGKDQEAAAGRKAMQRAAIEAQNDSLERQERDGSTLVKTRSGKGYKPGGTYLKDDNDLMNYEGRNVNMGSKENPNYKSDNPF